VEIKRREPGILKLTKMYNDLCNQLRSCVQRRKAPRNAVLPQPIDTKQLFVLDVNDDIWQDVGLGDNEDDDTAPLWLSDPNVRNGVKHVLVLDRCHEEESRLRKERTSLQQWMLREWRALQAACNLAGVLGQLNGNLNR
jgi:hypothetical protein